MQVASNPYDAPFASHLREFMASHPDTGVRTTQSALASYLNIRPQTVSLYCTGESLPNCEQLLRIATFFNVTCDFLMTGGRTENKPVRDLLGLSENAVQNMKLIKDGYFEDAPFMLAVLDLLLSDKDFYWSLEKTIYWKKQSVVVDGDMQEFCEWKAAKYLQEYLISLLVHKFL